MAVSGGILTVMTVDRWDGQVLKMIEKVAGDQAPVEDLRSLLVVYADWLEEQAKHVWFRDRITNTDELLLEYARWHRLQIHG